MIDVQVQLTGAMGLPDAQARRVLALAGRAPSVHNTQPWRFRLTESAIELHADPERQLPVADPDGAELRLSCGAALLNLRLALAAEGVRPVVDRMPDHRRPTLLATVRNGGARPPTPDEVALVGAVPRRRTNRRPFAEEAVTGAHRHELLVAARREGAVLDVVTDPVRLEHLGALSRQAHRRQLADPRFRDELGRWSGDLGDRVDGVPARAGGPAPAPRDPWVLRDFTDDRRPEPAGYDGFEQEPMIGVLSSHSAGPIGDLRAGEALQRVLLTATVQGLAVSPVSQLVELPDVREAVRTLVGSARPPQAVLRIGYGWPVTGSPRRPVEDLLVADGPPAVYPDGYPDDPRDPHDRSRLW